MYMKSLHHTLYSSSWRLVRIKGMIYAYYTSGTAGTPLTTLKLESREEEEEWTAQ